MKREQTPARHATHCFATTESGGYFLITCGCGWHTMRLQQFKAAATQAAVAHAAQDKRKGNEREHKNASRPRAV
jgi:hypothetical protein